MPKFNPSTTDHLVTTVLVVDDLLSGCTDQSVAVAAADLPALTEFVMRFAPASREHAMA